MAKPAQPRPASVPLHLLPGHRAVSLIARDLPRGLFHFGGAAHRFPGASAASTTHRPLDAGELAAAGVSEDMLRLFIGIQHIDDLLADLDQALASA